jgi:hypothetical protein
MGMTLWIHTLEGRDISTDSEDHTLMYRLSDDLDSLCDKLGVAKISSFFDSTDLEICMREDDDEIGADPEIDSETENSYGIDDMAWFDATSGLATFQNLRASIADNELPNLGKEDKTWLLEELDDCITKLKGSSERGGKFNLPIIM